LTGYHRSNLQHYFDLDAFIWINQAEVTPVAVPYDRVTPVAVLPENQPKLQQTGKTIVLRDR
jgi:hypothetical protein